MLAMSAVFCKRLSEVPGVEQVLPSQVARLILSGSISGVSQGSAWLRSFSHQTGDRRVWGESKGCGLQNGCLVL